MERNLKELQKLSLDQKIDHSIGSIEAFQSYMDGKTYVAFSKGRDSMILAYLVHMLFPNVPLVFCNTTNEWTSIIRAVKKDKTIIELRPHMTFKQIVEKYGFPLIAKDVSMAISRYRNTKLPLQKELRRNGGFNPNTGKHQRVGVVPKKWHPILDDESVVTTEKCCDILKKQPFKRFEKKTGLKPFIGTLASESNYRQMNYIKEGCNSFKDGKEKSTPLSIWTDEDITEFFKRFNLELPEAYKDKIIDGELVKGEKHTGCVMCGFGCHKDPERFERLRKIEPKRYNVFMNYKHNGLTYKEAINKVFKIVGSELLK